MADNGFDPHARYAALDERVTNIRSSMTNLEGEMRSGFTTINSHLNTLSNEFRSSTKTQWPVIWSAAGVMFAVLAGIGAILYTPVKADVAKLQENSITRNEWNDNQTRASENRQRLEAAVAKIAENAVTQRDLATMQLEYRDYKARMDNSISSIVANQITRNEWSERNQARDHEINNIRSAMDTMAANMQRQLDQQRQDFDQFSGSLGNGRDVIQRLQSEYDRMRDRLAELIALVARDQQGRTRLPLQ